MDSENRKCSSCGANKISPYWTFQKSAYCSFRCYAKSNARLLLFLSIFFGVLFVGSMTGLILAGVSPAVHTPFIIGLIFGPIPGIVISILGFIYRKEEKINNNSDMSNQ